STRVMGERRTHLLSPACSTCSAPRASTRSPAAAAATSSAGRSDFRTSFDFGVDKVPYRHLVDAKTSDRYRGRPRIRSPMMLRWTSDVPPAIDAALDHSHCRDHLPARGEAAPTTSSAVSDR